MLLQRPSQRLSRCGGEVRGAYDFLADTVTALDYDAVRHELVHAALFKTEGLVASRDEARVRSLARKLR